MSDQHITFKKVIYRWQEIVIESFETEIVDVINVEKRKHNRIAHIFT